METIQNRQTGQLSKRTTDQEYWTIEYNKRNGTKKHLSNRVTKWEKMKQPNSFWNHIQPKPSNAANVLELQNALSPRTKPEKLYRTTKRAHNSIIKKSSSVFKQKERRKTNYIGGVIKKHEILIHKEIIWKLLTKFNLTVY